MNKVLTIPEGKIDVVIDTDAFADSIWEMDDQYAIAYLLTFDKFNVKAFYTYMAGDDFVRGISEIVNRCGREDLSSVIFKGCTKGTDVNDPEKSEAALDLIERSKNYSKENPLYVIAIGPVTNIADALLIDPTLEERIVLVALFGHDFKQPITDEYNLVKDMVASKVIMETNLPIMLVPCIDVAKKLVMSYSECIEQWQGKNDIGDYLIYCMGLMCKEEYRPNLKRVIWDAVPVALLSHPEWVTYEITERPWLTFDKHWLFGKNDGKILYVSDINSEAIKKDIFERIKNYE